MDSLGFDGIPDTILGIPGRTFLLIIAVIVISLLLTKKVENFTAARPIVTQAEYIQDVRDVAAYVGPYIGEIYLYLRAKFPNVGPMYQPGSINDPTLADPLLPIARSQIKGWIDSSRLRLKQKYGDAFIGPMSNTSDIAYNELNGGILQVTHVDNGKKSTYIV